MRSTKPAAYSGSGTQCRRSFCGSDFSSSCTFSFSIPGTSHSQRRASTWFSAYSGTASVTPSRGVPGSKWYVSAISTPAIVARFGNSSVVTPAASWRIRSSRDRYSSRCLSSARPPLLTSSRYQRSNAAPVWMPSGIAWS
ncbi:hypothetical protein BamIOP4010DRAFT_6666 [Burkholderia ambifaria IOP40-10]|uniref:Uncharacterized protein n=1 Tax=Burkholderia ambifaria IOP40-10 TaxID=396596 RepID=B1FRK4_9BURK|nr:hypothetical protein BamIOP4010DRAFT_6666 [Burkholderia ambifaria IOP40-10]